MDSSTDKPKKKELSIPMDMVSWWEKKRLIYNLIILLMTILTLALFWKYAGTENSIDKQRLVIDAFWMLVWCNVLYTSGWVGGILRHHYLGSYPLPDTGRWLLFIFGTIFSVLVLEVRFSTLINPIFMG